MRLNRILQRLSGTWQPWAILAVLVAGPVTALVLLASGRTYLHVDAATDVVVADFVHGRPLAWPLEQATLLECSAFLQRSNGSPGILLGAGASIEVNAVDSTAQEFRSEQSFGIRTAVAVDATDIVVSIREIQHGGREKQPIQASDCAEANRTVTFDPGSGVTRGVYLPAQLRLPLEAVGEGVTLEFRGGIRVGADLAGGRQPLLTSGTVALRRVRASWLQDLGAAPFFEVDARHLNMGDKLHLATSNSVGALDVPMGFVRVRRGEHGPSLSVHAMSLAANAELVRPYSDVETPQVGTLRLLWRDELVHYLFSVWIVLVGAAVKLNEWGPKVQRMLTFRRGRTVQNSTTGRDDAKR